jgi:predicted NBD/HSP70 family sugar kinase
LEGDGAAILVFDVGGSHIAASVFDTRSAEVGAIRELPVSPDGESEKFFKAFESLASAIRPALASPAGIAVAVPSPFDFERGVSLMQHKFQSLYRMDLRGELSRRLSCPPGKIHFLNDAAASLLGEIQKGAAVGVNRAVGIMLGTGVGSAFALGGKIVAEGQGVPPGGEIWNQAYGSGIVEDFVSTMAIRRIFEQLTGRKAEVREIASSAAQQAQARQTFENFGRELGKVLRHTCLPFAPERIVLGGGIARSAALFFPAAEEALADDRVQLRVSELFERAPLIGAGASWMKSFGAIHQ